MKTYVIKYTMKSDNQTYSLLFHDGEYFGDLHDLARAARFPQKISYWRSEWKKQLKGVKSIQVFKLDNVPFEFLQELKNTEQKFLKYDSTAFLIRGGSRKSARCLYNEIMRLSYRQLNDILLYNMVKRYKPEHSDTPTNEEIGSSES